MSTTSDSIVVATVSAMEDLVSKIPALRGKVFHVYDEDELSVKLKGLTYPCAAVVYVGMNAVPATGGGIGASARIVLSVMVFFRGSPQAKDDPKENVLALLDKLRKEIRKERSPTGHQWQFLLESPASGKDQPLAYIQRWSTAVQVV